MPLSIEIGYPSHELNFIRDHIGLHVWGDSNPSLDRAKFRSNKKNRTFVLFFVLIFQIH
ncbi:hypothetical protein LEP1GSC039_2534 [Leptospira santarosai str. 2000027870]|nr:hypothetical protein LEP1GSC039_2534 [Leptospira santarosai str. 2000027870]